MYKKELEERAVIITDETQKILEFLNKSVERLQNISGDKSDHQLSADEGKLKNATGWLFAINRMGEFLGKELGTKTTPLKTKVEYLDPIANTLLLEYERFLTELLFRHKGDEAFKLIDKPEISNKSTLLREILLRFACEALNIHNEQDRDGHQVIKSMRLFLDNLRKSDVFFDKQYTLFAKELFEKNDRWMVLFYEVIATVKTLHSNKDALVETSLFLGTLKRAVISRIIRDFVVLTDSDLGCKEQLADGNLEYTLDSYERLFCKKFSLTYRGRSLSIYNSTFLTQHREDIVKEAKTLPHSVLHTQYTNLMHLNQLGLILEKVGNLVEVTGWFLFLTGIINLTPFSNRLSTLTKKCIEDIDQSLDAATISKFRNLESAWVWYARTPTLTQRVHNTVTDSLKNLQNPEVLKMISNYLKSDISELSALQQAAGFTVLHEEALEKLGLVLSPNTERYAF